MREIVPGSDVEFDFERDGNWRGLVRIKNDLQFVSCLC